MRLNELINEGTLEKIFVPSANHDTVHIRQIYLRLRGFGSTNPSTMVENVQKLAVDDEMLDSLILEGKPPIGCEISWSDGSLEQMSENMSV